MSFLECETGCVWLLLELRGCVHVSLQSQQPFSLVCLHLLSPANSLVAVVPLTKNGPFRSLLWVRNPRLRQCQLGCPGKKF
jgi:hypothetical protein